MSVNTPAAALSIAVVGHTNTGKTSLLRTLTRDSGFGEVSTRPSTTRQVQGARLLVDAQPVLELYDTPGLEDPIVLLELLDEIAISTGIRRDGRACIERFLQQPAAQQRFQQEAAVLRQVMASDAALYVIDARDPVLSKHRDELALLAMCAVPVLPVLNFVASGEANEAPWRDALGRAGLHARVRFDSVAPERDAERRLYEALAALLPAQAARFLALLAARERDALQRRGAALQAIAAMLVEVAAHVERAQAGDPAAEGAARSALADFVREREQATTRALLELFRFSSDDVVAAELPISDGRWGLDVFAAEALRQMGVRLGRGALAGAAAGAGIDVLVGGITLGAAAATGALIGGGLQTARHYGRRLLGRLRGQQELRADDALLLLLTRRADYLLRALEARGHAAVTPIPAPQQRLADWHGKRLPAALRLARAHPEWAGDSQREACRAAVLELAGELAQP